MAGNDRRFVSANDVETQVFDWGTLKWLSEPRVTDARNLAAGVVILESGRGHTRHNHPGVEEVLYVISGTGSQMVEDAEGRPVRQTVTAGDLVQIPADVYHETINIGWEPLRILAVYAPPGPEAFLRSLPECRIVPAGEIPRRE